MRQIRKCKVARIYLDSNVFSNIRDPKDPKYLLLKELLEKYKGNISLVFSHAHIRDKKKDATDMKFEDFSFMKSLVKDNYLSYHAIKQNCSFYLATPKMVFEQESDESLDELLNFFEPGEGNDEHVNEFKNNLLATLDMTEIEVERTMVESGVEKELIDKLFNGKEGNPSLLDISKGIADLTKDVITDGITYRSLRNLIDSGLGQNLSNVKENKLDLNDAFKDSLFQKTFSDFIKESIHYKDKTKIPYYDFYMLSYQVLDMIGISKEKLKKNNGFANILNDALHSYYARYCDILVSTDKGLIDKSKILYNMYEVQTEILSVEEFIEQLPEIAMDTDVSPEHFFTKLHYDIMHSQRKLLYTLDAGGEVNRLQEMSLYFNFFDVLLEEVSGDSKRYILCKSDTSYLSEPNFRETGRIIDRLVNVFGIDSEDKLYFDFDKETLSGGRKIMRKWLFLHAVISLGIEDLTGKFSLSITFIS